MTTALEKPRTAVAAWEEAPPLSSYLRRVLEEEAEQVAAPRQELPVRLTPATTRTPRPFAYD